MRIDDGDALLQTMSQNLPRRRGGLMPPDAELRQKAGTQRFVRLRANARQGGGGSLNTL
jgi:hypothetical protein